MNRYQQAAAVLKGDGCTSAPDFFYRPCCDEHDVYYRTGRDVDGEPVTRAEADKRLRQCMAKAGKTIIGRRVMPWLYWGAVRVFGGAHYGKEVAHGE